MGAPTPPLIQEPFGSSAGSSYITNPIPVASQVGVKAGAASYTDGFPPLTMTPVGSGGVDFYGQDLNGILYAATANIAALTGGQFWPYNGAWSAANSGYAAGAVLSMAANNGLWLNTLAGNTTNPDTTAASNNWVPLACYGATTIAISGGTTTLTAPQAATPILIVTGTLTSNVQIVVPTWLYRWRVINSTAPTIYSVTVKTASGTGVICPQFSTGHTDVYGDGTNINLVGMYGTGSFTPTFLGFSVNPSIASIPYKVAGNIVSIIIPGAPAYGTSDSTQFQIQGLPSGIVNSSIAPNIPAFGLSDNGTPLPSGIAYIFSNGTIAFGKDATGAAWTPSGQKGFYGNVTLVYPL